MKHLLKEMNSRMEYLKQATEWSIGETAHRKAELTLAIVRVQQRALDQIVSGALPLTKEHICFDKGHAFYLLTEIDNGKSKYGTHKCSRCGWTEDFQYDYDTTNH